MRRVRLHVSARSPADKAHGAGQGQFDDPFNDFLGKSFEEKPIWAGIYENFRDVLFPQKYPPLELTSTPVPTPDRMAVKTNPWAIGTATLANGGSVVLLILLGWRTTINHLPAQATDGNIHLKDFTLFAPPRDSAAGGGGGGGSNELTDPIMGRAPRQENMPLAPLQVPVLERPTLAVDPAVAVPLELKLPENATFPNVGVQKSPNVTLVSTGPGTRTGIGMGSDGGDGPGKGLGYGPGYDRGFGGSIYRPGIGGVTNPVPLVTPEAEFSDEARRSKYQGVCMISIIVDAQGYPRNPRVGRSLGMVLDEKAVEAVQRYRFKPAMKDGKPVASTISVEVNFRLY